MSISLFYPRISGFRPGLHLTRDVSQSLRTGRNPGSQDRGRRGLHGTGSTRVESRKEIDTMTHPSPKYSPTTSPSVSSTTIGVARSTDPRRESPISTLNWSSDSSCQNTVLMSLSPVFSLPGEWYNSLLAFRYNLWIHIISVLLHFITCHSQNLLRLPLN